jgi:hypothetical protein
VGRQTGTRGEEARNDDGESRSCGIGDLVGRRAALEREARQPRSDVEGGIADHRVVPVEEHGAVPPNAEIVAAEVAVDHLGAGKRHRTLGLEQLRQRGIEPLC